MDIKFDWVRVLEVMIGAASVFVPLWWATFQENRRNHQENVKKLDELLYEQEERPNHEHTERSGPLLAENIRYKPGKGLAR